MKRSLLFLLITLSGNTFAKQISEQTAKVVAKNFLELKTNYGVVSSASDLRLIYKESSSFPVEENYYYVFSMYGNNGFVIVSADDIVEPILGYSTNTIFSAISMPSHVQSWMENYRNQIRDAIEQRVVATTDISNKWQELSTGIETIHTAHKTTSVTPLIQTHWDQHPYYNAMCPAGSVTGCVATAMAQVMKYWNSPATGSGFHSYNSVYGTQSANFGITNYNWGNMPNSISSSNNDIATLMYHCGVSVDMNYSQALSGAYVLSSTTPSSVAPYCAEYALKTYFGYDPTTVHGYTRASYTDAQWLTLIENEINAIPARPVIYVGFGSGGGHCFVCDGYDNNNYLHFNFGWSGQDDGYYSINVINPAGVGVGGGSGNYNDNQEAIIGIMPVTQPNYAIKLYDYMTPNYTSIGYGNTISVTTNFWNTSTLNFTGDFTAALFDHNLNFVDYIQTGTGWNLPSSTHFTTNQTFSTTGLWNAIPGHYYIGTFSRPTNGSWVQVGNNTPYTNIIPIDIVDNGAINLYDSMVVTGGTNLISGQAASVHLDVINSSASTFNGRLKLDLWNYSTGLSYATTIQQHTGLSLPSTNHFTNGLTFSTSNLNVPAGTYLLGLSYIDTVISATTPYWVGSSLSDNYINPIIVTVAPAPLQPDIYEADNTPTTAYTFPANFVGNAVTINTTGSNIHIPSDVDYYKVTLPTGYNYTVTPTLYDAINSASSYTLDAIFSYSVSSSAWSTTFDNISPSYNINNGGVLYFWVAPHFLGYTGTYLLSTHITRTAIASNVENIETSYDIQIYPNPSNGTFDISLPQSVENITISDLVGRVVWNNVITDKVTHVNLTGQPDGVYFAHIKTSKEEIVEKIVLTH